MNVKSLQVSERVALHRIEKKNKEFASTLELVCMVSLNPRVCTPCHTTVIWSMLLSACSWLLFVLTLSGQVNLGNLFLAAYCHFLKAKHSITIGDCHILRILHCVPVITPKLILRTTKSSKTLLVNSRQFRVIGWSFTSTQDYKFRISFIIRASVIADYATHSALESPP
jgi:hypothetical protein